MKLAAAATLHEGMKDGDTREAIHISVSKAAAAKKMTKKLQPFHPMNHRCETQRRPPKEKTSPRPGYAMNHEHKKPHETRPRLPTYQTTHESRERCKRQQLQLEQYDPT